MENTSTTKALLNIVAEGGMISLKELPGQEQTPLKDKFFDQFTTYAPFDWKGSRRLTKAELKEHLPLCPCHGPLSCFGGSETSMCRIKS